MRFLLPTYSIFFCEKVILLTWKSDHDPDPHGSALVWISVSGSTLRWKVWTSKETSRTSKHEIFSLFYFCGSLLPFGSGSCRQKSTRTRIRNTGLMICISFYDAPYGTGTCWYLFIWFFPIDWLIDWLIDPPVCLLIDLYIHRCTLCLIFSKIFANFSGVCGEVQERRADRSRFLPSLALKNFSTTPFQHCPTHLLIFQFFLGLSVGVPSS